MVKRNRYRELIRNFLAKRDGDVCGLCGDPLGNRPYAFDHKAPIRHGGPDDLDNLQLTHLRCNQSKGSSDLENGNPDIRTYPRQPLYNVARCEHCGSEYQAARRTSRFCSTACRVANHRQQRQRESRNPSYENAAREAGRRINPK